MRMMGADDLSITAVGGGSGRIDHLPHMKGDVVVYGGDHPPLGRVVHASNQRSKVTIKNNVPNSSVTVEEAHGEIIVTITETPKEEVQLD